MNKKQLIDCGISELILSLIIMILSFAACMAISVFLPNNKFYEVLYVVFSYLAGLIYLYNKSPIYFSKELHKPILANKYTIIGIVIIVIPVLLHYYYSDNNSTYNGLILQYKISLFTEIIYLLSACIIIPICEEIIFRYYIYNIFKFRYGILFGVIASTLLFVGVHYNNSEPVVITLQCLLFTYVYEKSNSIFSSIIVHSFNNSMWHFVTYIASIQ